MPDDSFIPQFGYPFRRGVDSQPVEVDQDSDEDIESSMRAIISTPLGFRLELPTFGVDELMLREAHPGMFDDVRAALDIWDSRAHHWIENHPAEFERMVQHLRVLYQETGTND